MKIILNSKESYTRKTQNILHKISNRLKGKIGYKVYTDRQTDKYKFWLIQQHCYVHVDEFLLVCDQILISVEFNFQSDKYLQKG